MWIRERRNKAPGPMNDPYEFIDMTQKAFDFLVKDFGFQVTVTKSQGTYHSEVVFTTDKLKITIGMWGQSNEAWIIFFPQDKNFPPLHFSNLLNRITGDKTYFQEQVENKLPSTVFAQNYRQFLSLCADEIKRHCQSILAGDFSQWESNRKNDRGL